MPSDSESYLSHTRTQLKCGSLLYGLVREELRYIIFSPFHLFTCFPLDDYDVSSGTVPVDYKRQPSPASSQPASGPLCMSLFFFP